MAQFLDKQGLTTYSNLIKGELDALDARIEALETGGKYMPISGGTFTGEVTFSAPTYMNQDLHMSSRAIKNLAEPVSTSDAATKKYVDSKTSTPGVLFSKMMYDYNVPSNMQSPSGTFIRISFTINTYNGSRTQIVYPNVVLFRGDNQYIGYFSVVGNGITIQDSLVAGDAAWTSGYRHIYIHAICLSSTYTIDGIDNVQILNTLN